MMFAFNLSSSPVLRLAVAAMTCVLASCGSSGSGLGVLGKGKSAGGNSHFNASRAPWRGKTESACLKSGVGRGSPWIATRSGLGGPSVCGAIRPFRVSAVSGGRVRLSPPATIRCPMIPAVDRWMNDVVQPAARRHFRSEVTNIKVLASYACRTRNNQSGAKLSEHGFANALDIATFNFANGKSASVKQWRRGPGAARAFLRDVHKGSCRVFTTVLGPNADKYHHDHFHLDLARHGKRGTYHYCR